MLPCALRTPIPHRAGHQHLASTIYAAADVDAAAVLLRSYMVCVDMAGCCFVLALTHTYHDAFDMTALLTVVHPDSRHVDVTWPPPASPPPAVPPAAPLPSSPPAPPQQQQEAGQQDGHQRKRAGSAVARGGKDVVMMPGDAESSSHGGAAGGGARRYRFPMLLVGCDGGAEAAGSSSSSSFVLVDGVPLHQAAQVPVLHHDMRAA